MSATWGHLIPDGKGRSRKLGEREYEDSQSYGGYDSWKVQTASWKQ